jgi:two-component system NtrC family sensor kinase
MAQDVSLEDEDAAGLRKTYLLLRRQFHAGVPEAARAQRELSQMQALAAWAFRSGPNGWALVRRGVLKITNRCFDAFDRGSAIGPAWQPVADGMWTASDDGPGSRLAVLVTEEARQLVAQNRMAQRRRFIRGKQLVEVTVERSALAPAGDELVLVIVRDITELARSEAQLAEVRVRLMEKERAGLAGSLAVGVAHDLGNLVGALTAHVMVMQAGVAASEDTLQTLKAIVEGQSALLKKLKTLGAATLAPAQPLSLAEDVLEPARQMVQVWLQQRDSAHAVRVRLDESIRELPQVMGLRDDLVNMVINLIVNARDAMPQGGAVTIGGATDQHIVVVWVDDEGTGIPEGQRERIFDPFFSTKGKNGTGMGLAMARQIMRQLGGDIRARNREAGGARFELSFLAHHPPDGSE